jgi:3-oxoacyl-[acyl-carrier protein] reductase
LGDLDSKVALVTGASRGIGKAIALELAANGADLAICARSVERLQETAAAISELGRKVECYAVDLGDTEAIRATVAQVVDNFGRLDVLVNNAGVTHDTLLPRMSESHWDDVLNVNLRGSFFFTKAASRVMIKQRSGSIVNISSVVGIVGNAGQCNYAASKAGLIGMTKSLAKELCVRGIRVNAVAPGFIETEMTESLSEDAREKALANIPMGRLGTPGDIAHAVTFLAGDSSSYMTGQVVSVCGGMVM